MSNKPATQEDNIIVAFIVMVVGFVLLIFLIAQCSEQSEMLHQLDTLQEDVRRDLEFLENDLKLYYRLLRDLVLGLY